MTWPGEPAPSAVPLLALKSPALPMPRENRAEEICAEDFLKAFKTKIIFF